MAVADNTQRNWASKGVPRLFRVEIILKYLKGSEPEIPDEQCRLNACKMGGRTKDVEEETAVTTL
jgi:hypothetical protein